jgi:predicted AAA+ superfamily ATPase
MINRNLFPKIIELLTYFPAVGIVGPRQVGKTTLVKQISKHLGKQTVYLDLENPRDTAKLNDSVLFFENNIDKCIIIDEIQRQKDLFPILRSMIDLNRVAARFIIIGSASPDLIRDSSESLAGRIAYSELTTFNLTELDKQTDILKHWIWGGFPDAFLAPKKEINFIWYHNFVQTYVERDLPMLGLSSHPNVLRNLWTMIASINGNILNKATLTKSLEISTPTLNKYLSFFEEAFLIRMLKPYVKNIKKRLVKSPKIFIRDSGILHYMLGINNIPELQGHFAIGNSWEGYVIEQIIQLLKPGYTSFFYRTREGAECNLVIVKGDKVFACVEIKYTSVPKLTKSLTNSVADLNCTNNYIVTSNSDSYLLRKDIRVCSLSDFLYNYLPGFN